MHKFFKLMRKKITKVPVASRTFKEKNNKPNTLLVN